MIITFFFLTNIVLAAVVNEYDTNVQERRNRNTDYTLKCLKKAYHLLTQEEEDLRVKKGIKDSVRTSERRKERIDKKTVMELFDILNNDFPEFDCTSLCIVEVFYCISKPFHLYTYNSRSG